MSKLKVIDLFAGAGGLSEGFELAGFDVVAHIESDSHACKTLRRNFPNSFVFESDITVLSSKEIIKTIGEIDIIIGGPPCQGFSIVGRGKLKSLGRHHNDPRNVLYKQFVRFVREIKPRAFVMENVPGILMHNEGKTADSIKKEFELLGYSVSRHLLTASNYGVPQKRKRVFFVGTRDDLTFNAPESIPLSFTVRDALIDLPGISAGGGKEEMKYNKKPKTPYQKFMRKNSHGVFNHKARSYSDMDLKIFALMKEGMKYYQIPDHLKRYRDDSFRDKYKRLILDEPSWTVVAHLQKDGYMYIHPIQNRTITVREAARLQSFPDRFVFCGPMTQQFKQVGNAVPPLMARAVAAELALTLSKQQMSLPLIEIK